MRPVAALDLGTNSTRFLSINSDSTFITPSAVKARNTEITRLGEGVDATGTISEDASTRVLSTIETFQETVADIGAEWVGGFATSACRRADDEAVSRLFDRVESIIGIRPEIIDGRREAELTYKGVRASLDVEDGLIIDIGGGSTEWIEFDGSGFVSAESLPIGVVTLNERCVNGRRYTEESVACMTEQIRDTFQPKSGGHPTLVCVGGTGTTLASINLDLQEYSADAVHSHELDGRTIKKLLDEMVETPFDKLGDHPMIQSGREDVIVPGIKILLEGIRHSDSERVVVSDFGVLAGFLAEFVQ